MTQPTARLAALRQMTPEQLAELVAVVPCLEQAIAGRGPLDPSWPWGRPTGPRTALDLRGLAALLASDLGMEATLASLDAVALALVELAAWHGGRLERADALAEAGPDMGEALDRAAATLAARLVTDRQAGWVVLRSDVARVVTLPGMPVAPNLALLTSEQLAVKLDVLGRPTPSTKAARVEELLGALRDPEVIQALVERMPRDAALAFARLCAHGPQQVSDLGVPYFSPYSSRSRGTAIDWLLDHALVGVDTVDQVCFVWLDVLVALRGGLLFGDAFPHPRPVEPVPLRGNAPGLPPVLERLDGLLAQWEAQPVEALATGGLGVRAVRETAKALGLPAGELGLVANLAAELGLVGLVQVGATGRGRHRKILQRWAPTALAHAWRAETAARRWALLVQAWRGDSALDEARGLPERRDEGAPIGAAAPVLTREALLRLLDGLPTGTGIPGEDLKRVAIARLPYLMDGDRAQGLVAAMRVLGLVPADGPVGLTGPARALLDGPETLERALPAPSREVIVQADLTVIAPPDVASDLTAALARFADLESAAGARVYRLSEARLAAAVRAGQSEAEILQWLAQHSRNPVPQNVAYLVRDVARRAGRLRTGQVGAYLRCDDPGMLAQATGVRAAKLRLLAPTVAVSPLPAERLLVALRAKGVEAVAEDSDGVVLVATTALAEPVAWHATDDLPRLHGRVDAAVAAAGLLAQPVETHEEDVTDRLKRRGRTHRWHELGDELRGLRQTADEGW